MPVEEHLPLLRQACRQMRPYISPLADGTLRGFWGWYVRYHIARCAQCTQVLNTFRELRERLALLGATNTLPIADSGTSSFADSPALTTDALFQKAEASWNQRQQQDNTPP